MLTLADITSVDGRMIIIPTLTGQKILDRSSRSNWPTQQQPPPREWTMWLSALSQLHEQGFLQTPLTS